MITQQAPDFNEAVVKKVLVCDRCGTYLTETKEMTAKEFWDKWVLISLSAGFNTPRCPKCDQSTFSDLNISTTSKIVLAKDGVVIEFPKTIKKLTGAFFEEDHNDVCRCKERKDEHWFIGITKYATYGPVHAVCGGWKMAYKHRDAGGN